MGRYTVFFLGGGKFDGGEATTADLGVTSRYLGTLSIGYRLRSTGLLNPKLFLTGLTRKVICCFYESLSLYFTHLAVEHVHGIHLSDWL